jgi:hypothetical protein
MNNKVEIDDDISDRINIEEFEESKEDKKKY